MNDPDNADTVKAIMNEIVGQPCTEITACPGDDDHPPHLAISFGDMVLDLQHLETGIGMMLMGRAPKATSAQDFHASPGVLQ